MERKYKINIMIAVFLSMAIAMPAAASYLPFNTSVKMNVGIGSANPGQSLDVQGTVRATAFMGNGAQLTGINASQWTTTNANDVYLPNNGNVGIGTTLTTTSALSVMNGRVGIGTWVPNNLFSVGATGAFNVSSTGAVTSAGITPSGDVEGGQTTILFGTFSGSSGSSTTIYGGSSPTSHVFIKSTGITGNGDYVQSKFGNVGVGTTSVLMQGGVVGIGTYASIFALPGSAPFTAGAAGNLIVQGNVGVGSSAPGQALDVQGTVLATAFIGNGSGLTNLPSSSQWTTTNTNDVYLPSNGNVGIGTTITSAGAALTVMNGNVGIGTWVPNGGLVVTNGNVSIGSTIASSVLVIAPSANTANFAYFKSAAGGSSFGPGFKLDATANSGDTWTLGTGGSGDGAGAGSFLIYDNTASKLRFVIDKNGNIGMGNALTNSGLTGASLSEVSGNIGIGSLAPGQLLDVQGTVRALSFSGNGSQLTGITPSQWTTTNTNDVYLPSNGNVGLGTNKTSTAALTVMNGNVGIGTWVPALPFSITGDSYFNGNIGIGTTFVGGAFGKAVLMTNGNVGIGTWTWNNRVDVNGTVGATRFQPMNAAGITVGLTVDSSGLYYNATNYDLISVSALQGDAYAWNIASGSSGNLGGSVNLKADSTTVATFYKGYVGIGTFNAPVNVGIGTFFPVQTFSVVGNIGIGTIAYGDNYITTAPPNGGMIVEKTIGIGTYAPTGALEVEGNVGIGTAFTGGAGEGGLTVMNGNVGIGTWVPGNLLQVGNGANPFTVNPSGTVSIGNVSITNVTGNFNSTSIGNSGVTDNTTNGIFGGVNAGSGSNAAFLGGNNANSFVIIQASYKTGNGDSIAMKFGNLGIGTEEVLMSAGGVGIGTYASSYITTTPPSGGLILGGNVGIGSLSPGQILDVTGTVRATAFIGNGSQLTGITSSQWTTTNTHDVYLPSNGNVGIGTTITSAGAALSVMNGNVGIGSVSPGSQEDIYSALAGTSSSDIFRIYSGNGTLRTDIRAEGIQSWFLNSGSGEVGSIGFSTPGALPGMVFENSSGTGRSQLGLAASGGGLGFAAESGNGALTSTQMVLDTNGNLGIGTTTPIGGLAVMNGNVGIGTWVPGYALTLGSGALSVPLGAVVTPSINFGGSATTGIYSAASGYVGLVSGSALIAGVDASTKFEIYNNKPVTFDSGLGHGDVSLYRVAAAQLALGDGNFNAANGTFFVGNIGIGTTLTTTSALSVMNGNVGIGTWLPAAPLESQRDGIGAVAAAASAPEGLVLQNTTVAAAGAQQYSPSIRLRGQGWKTNATAASQSADWQEYVIPVQGAANPTSQLYFTSQINGGGYSNTTGLLLSSVQSDTTPFIGLDGTNNPNNGIGTGAGNEFSFILSGTQVMSVSSAFYNKFAINGTTVLGWSNGAPGNTATTDTSFSRVSAGNVGIGTSGVGTGITNGGLILGNIGIGTTKIATSSLTVMNGNVGIGTWVPADALEVNGFIQADVQYQYPGGFGALADNGGNLHVPEALLDSGDSPGTSGECLTTTGTQVAWGSCSGNVGVGTGFPSSPLHSVQFNNNGNFGGSSNFVFNGTNVGIGTVLSQNTLDVATNVSIGTAYAGYQAAPSNGLIVQGNVGIGTWLPNSLLTISGTTSASQLIFPTQTTTANIPVIQFGTAPTGGGADMLMGGTVINGTDVLHFVGGGNADLSVGNTPTILIQQSTGNKVAIDAAGNIYTANAGSNGPGTTLTLQNSQGGNVGIGTTIAVGGVAIMNGNVGIGTWVPAAPLYVADYGNCNNVDFSVAGLVTITKNCGSTGQLVFNSANSLTMTASAMTTPGAFTLTTFNPQITATGNGPFVVNGSAGVGGGTGTIDIQDWKNSGGSITENITPVGNLGIGTVVPLSKLNINGGVGIGTTLTNGNYLNGNSAPSGGLIVQGNVGLGTWLPTQALTVAGNLDIFGANATDAVLSTAANNLTVGGVHVISGFGSWVRGTRSSGMDATAGGGNLGLYAGGNQYLTVTTGGNVGIGTTTPQGALVVTNGNVGIGTWVPGAALQVNNTMSFQSEYNNGSQASNFTVNWNNGNKQKIILTGSTSHTVSFTAPSSGVTNLLLEINQGSGSDSITWPAAVKWPSSETPALTTTSGQEDIITCFYNGTDYFCTAAFNYAP